MKTVCENDLMNVFFYLLFFKEQFELCILFYVLLLKIDIEMYTQGL